MVEKEAVKTKNHKGNVEERQYRRDGHKCTKGHSHDMMSDNSYFETSDDNVAVCECGEEIGFV